MVSAAASANAALVSISMTADNIVSGGLCEDASCQSIAVNWSDLGALPNANNWKKSDTVSVDLEAGVYSFAWLVENSGNAANNNPAALLAEITSDGDINFSSSAWEVFDVSNGALIASASEYGQNGEAGLIWTRANGGAINGISTSASWAYSDSNFANADRYAWLRTVVEIKRSAEAVSAPASLGFVAAIVLFLVFRRVKSA